MAGWKRKVENKAKAKHSTDIIPSKLIAELQHSARLGKTFPSGWVGKSWEKANLSQLVLELS